MGYGIKDSPWHITVLTSDGETRQATRCIYFKHIKQKRGICSIKSHRCTGSAHCDEYQEKGKTCTPPREEKEYLDMPPKPPAKSPSKKEVLMGEIMLSPNKERWKIVDVNIDEKFLYVVTENKKDDAVRKIGFQALKNPSMGRWVAEDDSIQKYILHLLEK